MTYEHSVLTKFGGQKKTIININNFAGLSRKWVGVKSFMCFPLSWGKRETHKQNSQEISAKGRDSPGIAMIPPALTLVFKRIFCRNMRGNFRTNLQVSFIGVQTPAFFV